MTSVILAPELILPGPRSEDLGVGAAVLVEGGRIAHIGPLAELRAERPATAVKTLDRSLLMAGFVNSHQHGRGISQIQLGYPDDFLETWIAGRRARGVLDPYSITRLAAARMAANGVTTAIHANYSYGSGDYENEVRESIRAYLDVGIRVAMCIGILDRGTIAYPPHDACFCAGLPRELADWLAAKGRPAYMADAEATVALMHRLRLDFADEERVRLCYGPAGPQWVKEDSWRLIAADAQANHIGIHLHALESAAQRDAIRELYPDGVFKALGEFGALTPRTVIAHGVWMQATDMTRIAEAGATVVRNPGSNLRLRSGIAPLAEMLAAGVRVAIGTDNTACDDTEDLLGELRMAHLLARAPEWSGPRPPTSEQLLAMLTVNGAVAAGFPEADGTIAIGRPADLVAIRLDHIRAPYFDVDMPLAEALIARGRGVDVSLTMVAGDILFEDGHHTTVDLAEVEAAAVASAFAARQPADPANVWRTRQFRAELGRHYRGRGDATARILQGGS